MVPVELRLNVFSLLILLGVFQGFFISYFLLKKENRKLSRNIYLGLFVLTLSLVILEILLNYTGFIVRIIWFDNFAEPLNFAIAPLLYLYIISGLHPEKSVAYKPHFIVFSLYLIYSFLYFIQSDGYKLNAYYSNYFPKLASGAYQALFDPDPLHLRTYIYEITFVQFVVYIVLSIKAILEELHKKGISFFRSRGHEFLGYRNSILHFVVITVIIIGVKIHFGRDIGDYFIASYGAFILYLTSISIVSRSSFFSESSVENTEKYRKSSLEASDKEDILRRLQTFVQNEKYYADNMASLPDLSVKIGETSHKVSQVINEKCGMNFYTWLAKYRIDEAKKILSGPERMKYKIEEVGEMVGYNSKASFNKAFKNLTGKTPSEYRNSF
jgi:AraC-like DNA-binding protein